MNVAVTGASSMDSLHARILKSCTEANWCVSPPPT